MMAAAAGAVFAGLGVVRFISGDSPADEPGSQTTQASGNEDLQSERSAVGPSRASMSATSATANPHEDLPAMILGSANEAPAKSKKAPLSKRPPRIDSADVVAPIESPKPTPSQPAGPSAPVNPYRKKSANGP
jgi:hypothetical protein